MSVPPLSKSIGWTRGIAEARNMMLDLQRQLVTGKKAATYGGLGAERNLALAGRSKIAGIEAFQSSIQQIDLRLKTLTQVLDRFNEIAREVRSDAVMPSYNLSGGDRTGMQLRAENALDEALGLMRADVAGRYLFGGKAVDAVPVATKSAILDGEGGKAGFRQVLAERKAADLGADGLGRLELDRTASEVAIAEDHDGPFGFKITAIETTVTGAATSPPAGVPPAVTIDFDGAAPQNGETVRLTLALPDGTETHVVLTVGNEAGPGRFAVGADADETAANFMSTLEDSLGSVAATKLSAASGFAASEDFFNIDADNPPRRVDGPPFDTAVGHRDATPADTVFWYVGEGGTDDPRQTAIGRVDEQITVSYGARANETALRWSIQNYAVLAAETYDAGVDSDMTRYDEMTHRAVTRLAKSDGRPSPESMQAHLAAQHHTLGKAQERHHAMKAMSQVMVDQIEEADPSEVAVMLLQLNTRLQASYQTTAMLSQMSLVYHM